MKQPDRWQIILILILGILGVSLAAIWIRLAVDTVNPSNRVGFGLFLAASRLILAALILLPSWRNFNPANITNSSLWYAIAAGICLALHFATWIVSLAYTSIAASTVLVTTNPIWVGIINWWWYEEKLSKKQILGIAIALLGSTIIALGDRDLGGNYLNPFLGDILALVGAIMSSLYIVFGSVAQRQGMNTNNYVAIVYSLAAICLFPLPLFYQTSYFNYPNSVYLYILLMAVLSQAIGHTSLNWSMRWFSPTTVSLSLLLEPVIASAIGAIVFQEIPTISLLMGGMTILFGILYFTSNRNQQIE